TLRCRQGLASSYASAHRWADAEELFRDTLARCRKAAKPSSPYLAGPLGALAGFLLMRSRSAEAEPFLRESLAIQEKQKSDDWSRFSTMSMLGEALAGQRRFAEAEPLVVGGYEGMKARASRMKVPHQANLSTAAERVVRLYEEWNKPAQA